MFLLPNNIKIDEEGLIKALNDKDASHLYYLDDVTGQVGCIDNKDNKIINNVRYFKVPKIAEKTKKKWIKEFIKEMVVPENRFIANLFNKTLKTKSKSTEHFFKLLETTDWKYGWPQWERDNLYDEMMDWFDTLPVEIKDNWELDDDCIICQGMKEAKETGKDLNVEDLKELFKKENKKRDN